MNFFHGLFNYPLEILFTIVVIVAFSWSCVIFARKIWRCFANAKPGLPSTRAYRRAFDMLVFISVGLLIFAGAIESLVARSNMGALCVLAGIAVFCCWHFFAAGLRAFLLPGRPVLFLIALLAQIAIPFGFPCFLIWTSYQAQCRFYMAFGAGTPSFTGNFLSSDGLVALTFCFVFIFSILAGLRFPKHRRLTSLWNPRRLPKLPPVQRVPENVAHAR